MQSSAQRKEAIRKFKERKVPMGVFAVRCTATAQVWVGSALNLDSTRNRFWFCLRHGSHPDQSLQNEWNAHGEEAFQYETLDTLDDDVLPMAIKDLLKEKKCHWIARLGAREV
jgi:hypothetical protein